MFKKLIYKKMYLEFYPVSFETEENFYKQYRRELYHLLNRRHDELRILIMRELEAFEKDLRKYRSVVVAESLHNEKLNEIDSLTIKYSEFSWLLMINKKLPLEDLNKVIYNNRFRFFL